ncbi:hypothetical protein, variant [Spizellomyces punctatus DAOM BR117]|nr:hypothetical protein, variant [Spizellomyces punctatus DAOM BR117]KND04789.1 hypothetical protein, variant [Spizellomyces punctatus DAOM BR117]|eukprot:XP_016612828.1 hypothetical protein, variant [Spizellomyces punctatus DAOM BR117]
MSKNHIIAPSLADFASRSVFFPLSPAEKEDRDTALEPVELQPVLLAVSDPIPNNSVSKHIPRSFLPDFILVPAPTKRPRGPRLPPWLCDMKNLIRSPRPLPFLPSHTKLFKPPLPKRGRSERQWDAGALRPPSVVKLRCAQRRMEATREMERERQKMREQGEMALKKRGGTIYGEFKVSASSLPTAASAAENTGVDSTYHSEKKSKSTTYRVYKLASFTPPSSLPTAASTSAGRLKDVLVTVKGGSGSGEWEPYVKHKRADSAYDDGAVEGPYTRTSSRGSK